MNTQSEIRELSIDTLDLVIGGSQGDGSGTGTGTGNGGHGLAEGVANALGHIL